MFDKNGTRIQAGDIVRITGAYFKTDNALYFVEQDGTNPGYLANDESVTLRKICKNGKISTSNHSIAFFPLTSTVSDRMKTAEAAAWNKEHAAIEIVHGLNTEHVLAWFEEEARKQREQEEYYTMRGYDWENWGKKYADTAAWYESVVKNMTAGGDLTLEDFVEKFC